MATILVQAFPEITERCLMYELKELGYKVITASNEVSGSPRPSDDLINKIRDHRPDAIVYEPFLACCDGSCDDARGAGDVPHAVLLYAHRVSEAVAGIDGKRVPVFAYTILRKRRDITQNLEGARCMCDDLEIEVADAVDAALHTR